MLCGSAWWYDGTMRSPVRFTVVGTLLSLMGLLVHGCATGGESSDDGDDGGLGSADANAEAGGSSGAVAASSSGGTGSSASGGNASSGSSSGGGTSSSSSSSSGNGSSSSSSASSSSSGGVPSGWTCFSGYDDGFRCDCGCGVRDPDCTSGFSRVCETCDEINCNAFSFDECIGKLRFGDNATCDF